MVFIEPLADFDGDGSYELITWLGPDLEFEFLKADIVKFIFGNETGAMHLNSL